MHRLMILLLKDSFWWKDMHTHLLARGTRAPFFWMEATEFLTDALGRNAEADAVVAATANTNKAWMRIWSIKYYDDSWCNDRSTTLHCGARSFVGGGEGRIAPKKWRSDTTYVLYLSILSFPIRLDLFCSHERKVDVMSDVKMMYCTCGCVF